ncbi:DNRLRE domain-containing protein, partial [Nocardioides sp. GCM10030258]
MVTAIAQGSQVEDLSARTPSSAMFANPDSTWTLESYSGLVRSRADQDKWVSVNADLENLADGAVPAAVPFDIEYGDGGSKDVATVTSPSGATLSLDWPTKLPAGTVDGDQITFEPAAIDGGDLVVTSHPEGFNFSVVLDQAPAAGEIPEYRFPLSLSEGKFITRADGSIDIKSEGKLVGSITPPVMWDSADEASTVPVAATLEGTGTSRELVLRPDPVYLADPDRRYPVTVDPTVVLTATGDTWVQNILPNTSQHTSPELRVGTSNLGITQNRSYLNFDTTALGSPPPGSIADAKVSLSNFNAGSCSGSDIKMSQVTSAWTVPGITWSTQPTVTATGAKVEDDAHGFTGCTSEGVVDFNATDIVKSWVGGADNYGVQLAAVTLNNASYRKYRSLENGDNAKSPKLTVTISQPPATPTGLTATPGLYGNFITSKTPTLSSVVTDPDGGQVKGYFEIKQGSTLVWPGDSPAGTSPAVPSGGTATKAVPSGHLTEGGTYTISAWGEDDVNVRSATPATKTVTVDTIAPTVTITSSHFTNGTWTTTMPGSDTITLNGSADTAGFYFNLDGQTSAAGANSSGDKVTTYTPTPGWHVYEVTPVDKAGNYGTPVTFSYGTGTAAFSTPTQWAPSTASFPIDLSGPASATGATLQWRVVTETTWRTAAKVKKVDDGTNWTGTIAGAGTGRSTTNQLIWNATEETYGTGTLEAPALLEVRGCFQYSGSADSCTTVLYLGLYQSAFGERFPTTDLGPATVSLLNGEAMVSDADAADSKAGIGRSFSSLSDATLTAGVFGPGWSDPEIFGPSADTAASVIDSRTKDGTIVIVDSGGGSQTFIPTGGGNYKPLEPTGDTTTLIFATGTPNTLELSRPLGTGSVVTTWEWSTSDIGGDPAWTLKETNAPGTGNDIAVTRTGQRPTFVRQSDPTASSTCTATTQTLGCRALTITYTGTGTATRVASVQRVIGAATPGAVNIKTLADYTYTSGKLTKVCSGDPDGAGAGIPLCTEYSYTTVASRTMLATLKPAGLTEWRFAYDTIGRLENVKRERPTASGGGDATWSIDYSLTPASAGLPSMTAAKVSEWGQTVVPTKVYAVYQPYNGTADVTKADLFYTDRSGNTTNTAAFGPDGWLLSTDWVDAAGNTRQSLDATGWARVQAAPLVDRPMVALEASSFTVFNTWGNADTVGTRAIDEYGPAHTASLDDGTVGYFRTHAAFTYDDDPGVDPSLLAGRPGGIGGDGVGLVVKETFSTATADRTADHDTKVTTYGYAPVVSGDGDGWVLGTPTSTSVKVTGSTWSTTTNRFDSDGRSIETREPGGGTDGSGAGNDARSTTTTYYTADGSGACGGKPAWDGMVCKTGPAAQPAGTTTPITYHAGFDDELNPTSVQELSGGAGTRTTTKTYDNLGRVLSSSVVVGGSEVAADTITNTYGYAVSTGLSTTVTASAGSTGTVTTSYDAWGRETGYQDVTGNTAATTYDATGRLATSDTGTTSTSYAYDAHSLLTGVTVDNGVGSFGYQYATDGTLEELSYPNGLAATYHTDEIGGPTGITYSNSSGTVLAFTASNDVRGRALLQSSPASSQVFTYDGLDRLTAAVDTRADGCITRVYGFSASSERTSLASHPPGAGGACQSTSASTKTTTYDTASRVTNTGYSYDPLGRTLTVPTTDTTVGAAGALTVAYRANDMVASQTQDVTAGGDTETKTVDYELDPGGRISSITFKTDGTETKRSRYRYSSTSDSPSSIETSTDTGASWVATKYVAPPGRGLAAEVTGGAVTFQIINPHGDIVASTTSAGTVEAYGETDEYGNPLSGTPDRRYGWLGELQRSTDSLAGLTLMGLRLYNPDTGAFLSVDSIAGANNTPYAYPQDPINEKDPSGACPRPLIFCSEIKQGRDPNRPGVPDGYIAIWHKYTSHEKGELGEKRVAAMFRKIKGVSDVHRGRTGLNYVRFINKLGKMQIRIFDISLVYKGLSILIEVKANKSRYRKHQREADEWLSSTYGLLIGFVRI